MSLFWKADPLADAQLALECSKRLHRQAGLRGWSCDPKRSHIGIGAGYYAEINQVLASPHIRYNVKLGQGPTPLHAALDGYRQVIDPAGDPLWAVTVLEVELYFLSEAARVHGKLDAALAQLELLVTAA